MIRYFGTEGFLTWPPAVNDSDRSSLSKPCTEFLAQNGLEDAQMLVRLSHTPYGYGFIEHVPALYCLMNVGLGLHTAVQVSFALQPNFPCYIRNGTSSLIRAMADELVHQGVHIHTNTEVYHISRPGKHAMRPVEVSARSLWHGAPQEIHWTADLF